MKPTIKSLQERIAELEEYKSTYYSRAINAETKVKDMNNDFLRKAQLDSDLRARHNQDLMQIIRWIVKPEEPDVINSQYKPIIR